MLAAVTGSVVVTASEPVIIPLLRRVAAIDIPGHRSSHSVPTPRGGGIPIAAGLLAAAAILHDAAAVTFAVAVAAFGLIGFADNLHTLRVRTRLGLQVLASAVVAAPLVWRLHQPPIVLAAAIGMLAADPGRRAAMGSCGREYVERNFDLVKLARRYGSLLEAHGGRQ